MKTNKPGKQNPLFLYVDKIAFAVLVLAAAYYCYSAVSLPKITWTPEQLRTDADQAQQKIDNSEYRVDLQPANYDKRALDIRAGIPAKYYQTSERWEAPVFREKIMRVAPKTFAVLNLRAVDFVGGIRIQEGQSIFNAGSTTIGSGMSDMGAFDSGMSMMGSGTSTTGGIIESKRWVILTGLIPYEAQLREYIDKYANALHSSPSDYPEYLYLDIERNEIGQNDADGNPIWVSLPVNEQLNEYMKTWAGTSADPVDFQYTLPPAAEGIPPMASRLPPLANRQFSYEVAYPPYIPLLSDSQAGEQELRLKSLHRMQEGQKVMTPDEFFDPETGNIMGIFTSQGAGTGYGGGNSGMTGGGMGTGGGGSRITPMYQGTTGGGMGTGIGTPGRSNMGYSGSSDGMMSGGYGGMGGMSGGMGNTTNQWSILIDVPPSVYIDAPYRLFRYFDFSVEPGKAYQYRVRLALKNPNYMLADRFLDEATAQTKREALTWTPFSLPSGAVSVYSNARILTQDVTAARADRPWQLQSVTVASLVYDEVEKADYIAKNKTAAPGTVLNFPRTSGSLVETQSTTSGGSYGGGSPSDMMGGAGNTQTASTTKKSKTLDHVSGECVLDVVGKRKLMGSNTDHTPAGQVMVMAFDGTLKIQAVKNDKLELDRYEKKETNTMGGMYGM